MGHFVRTQEQQSSLGTIFEVKKTGQHIVSCVVVGIVDSYYMVVGSNFKFSVHYNQYENTQNLGR